MNVSLEPLRNSKTTALTKSYLAEVALQLLYEQDKAIAAAVQAERANNDKWFSRLVNVWNTGNIGKVNEMLEDQAAAIRARNGGKS